MAKQRQVRIEQGLPQNLMEDMQERTNEQLESETKYRSIALAILGARAAERYDAPTARTYFQRAIAASRPQERMQIRRMADASLALAERRADDLKVAVERLGGEAPSGRALMGLRLMGLIVPPPGSGLLLKARGFGVVALIVIILLAAGLGVVELVSLPFGGVGLAPGLLLGLIVDGVALSILAFYGRRRQRAARPGVAGKAVAPGAAPKRSLAARFSTKPTTDAKASTGARRSPQASGSNGRKGSAADAAKTPPARSRPSAKATTSGSGSGSGTSARRGGATGRGAPGTAKGAAPVKPAKGGAAPPPKKGPARPKRPSR